MTALTHPCPTDWTDPAYLQQGTPRQQAAFAALESLGIWRALRPYTPVLVGTVPLDLDIPGSDLDVICEAHNLPVFERGVVAAFGRMRGFAVWRHENDDLPAVVATFRYRGWPVEVFGQSRPVTAQNAYRHMGVEARLLALAGEQARVAIRALKESGLKTEPAFARYFGLAGDPYQRLLALSRLDDTALAAAVGL